jgi:hypothetical protein
MENNVQMLDGVTIYPTDYFAPKSNTTGELNITENTHSIHHYDASWVSSGERSYYRKKRILSRLFGIKLGILISIPFFFAMNIRCYGPRHGLKRFFMKLLNKQGW